MQIDREVSGVVPVRVIIIDDHPILLSALAHLLGQEYPSIEVLGTACNSSEALELVRTQVPDVAILDLDLGGESGLDLIVPMLGYGNISILVLTASSDPRDREHALAAGARGFLSKLSPAAELIAAVLAHGRRLGDLSCPASTD